MRRQHQEGSPITAENGRIASHEGTTPPPSGYTSWDEYMTDVVALDDAWEAGKRRRAADYEANHHLSLRISKAMRLAPNTIVYRTLLEEQEVPVSALDQDWRKRYGL